MALFKRVRIEDYFSKSPFRSGLFLGITFLLGMELYLCGMTVRRSFGKSTGVWQTIALLAFGLVALWFRLILEHLKIKKFFDRGAIRTNEMDPALYASLTGMMRISVISMAMMCIMVSLLLEQIH